MVRCGWERAKAPCTQAMAERTGSTFSAAFRRVMYLPCVMTPPEQRLLATALFAHGVFESKDGGRSWQKTPDAGVSIRSAMNYQGRLLAASAYNGLLLEQNSVVESASDAAHGGDRAPAASQQ